jgi:hypothetical protein
MSENGAAPAPPEEDRTPTQEDLAPVAMPQAAGGWVMPQPVFRQSDGYTPRTAFNGNEDDTVMPDPSPAAPDAEAAVKAESGVAAQPDITEEPNPVSADPVTIPVKKKRSWFRIFLIIIGIVLLVAGATAIILMVALGYFLQIPESQNLN